MSPSEERLRSVQEAIKEREDRIPHLDKDTLALINKGVERLRTEAILESLPPEAAMAILTALERVAPTDADQQALISHHREILKRVIQRHQH